MDKIEKQLLLKDLCGRLPYGLKFQSYHSECGIEGKGTFDFEIGDDVTLSKLKHLCESGNNKSYLRPLSSMTEDERKELSKILNYEFYVDDDFALVAEDDRHRIRLELCEGYIDWLNEHHFDFRNLIEKGLALEAKEGMYEIK